MVMLLDVPATIRSPLSMAAVMAAIVVLVEFRLVLCYLDRWRLRFLIARKKDEPEEESEDESESSSEDESESDDEHIQVSSLYIYPLKSARECRVKTVKLDELGFVNDRRLMVMRGTAPDKPIPRFITQRQAPHLVTVSAKVNETNNTVTLSCPNKKSLTLDVSDDTVSQAKRRHVGIWDDEVIVADLGDDASRFIQDIIHVDEIERNVSFGDARLVSILPNKVHNRPSDPDGMPFAAYHRGRMPQISMVDAYPFLICSQESLAALNRRLVAKGEKSVPMKQFRPNIVVKGNEAFEEDYWKVFKIGDMILHVVSSCPRCKLCCINQKTGKVALEPLETLGEFREFGEQDEAYFGVYAVAQDIREHTISVGDEVTVLLEGDPEYDE